MLAVYKIKFYARAKTISDVSILIVFQESWQYVNLFAIVGLIKL
jgi:hypothetical protein